MKKIPINKNGHIIGGKTLVCPKCLMGFVDMVIYAHDQATQHAKENKHWGDYNFAPKRTKNKRKI